MPVDLTPHVKDVEREIYRKAIALIREARQSGVLLRIDLRSVKPLAMGNLVMLAEVRLMNKPN